MHHLILLGKAAPGHQICVSVYLPPEFLFENLRGKNGSPILMDDFKVLIFPFHHFQNLPRATARLSLLPHRVRGMVVNFSPRTQQRKIEEEGTTTPHWPLGRPLADTGHPATDRTPVCLQLTMPSPPANDRSQCLWSQIVSLEAIRKGKEK